VGGIILDPRGKVKTTYAWGLRNSTNNQAKACGLFQGLRIATDSMVKSLIVIGDSSTIIKLMALKSTLVDNKSLILW
jgi:ribonuclease HI